MLLAREEKLRGTKIRRGGNPNEMVCKVVGDASGSFVAGSAVGRDSGSK